MSLSSPIEPVRAVCAQEQPVSPVPAQAGLKRILVVNSKGGCGKTTIATNLVSYYAHAGLAAAILDFDPQGSSTRWLASRPEALPPIQGVIAHRTPAHGMTRSFQLRVPPGIQRVVVDTPAGIAGQALLDQVKTADVVLIPVLASPLDIDAAAHFIKDLSAIARVRAGNVKVGLIANRVRNNTRIFHALVHFLYGLNVPFVGRLRDTQNYIKAAAEGVGVYELRPAEAAGDQKQWNGLMGWIEGR